MTDESERRRSSFSINRMNLEIRIIKKYISCLYSELYFCILLMKEKKGMHVLDQVWSTYLINHDK